MPVDLDLNALPPRTIECWRVDELPHVEFHWQVNLGRLWVVFPLQGNRTQLLFDRITDAEQGKQCVAAWCAGYRCKAEELGAPAIGRMPTIITP